MIAEAQWQLLYTQTAFGTLLGSTLPLKEGLMTV